MSSSLLLQQCPACLMRSGRKRMAEGTILRNQETIRTFGEKETSKNLEMLEVDTIKQAEMKGKNT